MSVYKGTQLIAANGAPGRNGTDGRPGTDAGVMIVSSFTELHNNLNPGGVQEVTNTSTGSNWSSVGGYRSSISAGQASIVFGYGNSLSGTQNASVFGYNNNCSQIGQGGLISGYNNTVTNLNQGSVVFGMRNTVNGGLWDGFTILGMGHDIYSNINMSEGGIVAGFNVSEDSSLPTLPHQRPNYQSNDLIRIGLKVGDGTGNGEVGIRVRNDGCVGIAGDLSFNALDSGGNSLGTYTLGEIVKALQNAGILTPPV